MTRLISWLANEWRLICADSWAGGVYAGPPDPHPCTSSDPRCARLIERQEEVSTRMARMKSRVIDGRPITSAAATDVKITILRAQAAAGPQIRGVEKRRGAK